MFLRVRLEVDLGVAVRAFLEETLRGDDLVMVLTHGLRAGGVQRWMSVQKLGLITPPETQALRNNPWARHRLLNWPNLA